LSSEIQSPHVSQTFSVIEQGGRGTLRVTVRPASKDFVEAPGLIPVTLRNTRVKWLWSAIAVQAFHQNGKERKLMGGR
jgi:hypothetical protein